MPPKRKSDTAPASSPTKKARLEEYSAIALVDDILADRFELPETIEGIKKYFRDIAQYADSLHKGVVHNDSHPKKDLYTDLEVANVLFHLNAPSDPQKYMKNKLTAEKFEEIVGDINASAMWDNLVLMDSFDIRWSASGEFKFSGKYGAPRHLKRRGL